MNQWINPAEFGNSVPAASMIRLINLILKEFKYIKYQSGVEGYEEVWNRIVFDLDDDDHFWPYGGDGLLVEFHVWVPFANRVEDKFCMLTQQREYAIDDCQKKAPLKFNKMFNQEIICKFLPEEFLALKALRLKYD